jgi:hypothetical protein
MPNGNSLWFVFLLVYWDFKYVIILWEMPYTAERCYRELRREQNYLPWNNKTKNSDILLNLGQL